MLVSEPLAKESRKEYALRVLRENIVKWELKPGSYVSEQKLAEELHLSRIPVREALKELSKSDIVEIYPQRGSKIAPINFELIQEAEFFRRVLDCAVTRLSCEMATEENFEWLRNHLKQQEYFWQNSAPDRLNELDSEYHMYYYKICNKMRCYTKLQEMNIHFDRLRHISFLMQTDCKLVDDHRRIFEAVMARDPDLAEKRVIEHLQRYQMEKSYIEKAYKEYME